MKEAIVLAGLLSVLSLPVSAGETAHKEHLHWSYSGDTSPEHWGDLSQDFAACKWGKQQSPVDLSASDKYRKDKLDFHYRNAVYKVENNGHTLEAQPLGDVQHITIDGKPYAFRQFHFHVPGEHTFKGQSFPMEAHFVHKSDDGGLAVVSVVFKEGKANHALTPLLLKPLQPSQSFETEQKLNIRALFPNRHQAFRLTGSLTTPPCSEGVKWIIYDTPVDASREQIQAMAAIIGQKNNRPVQPLNGREIIETVE